MNLAMDRDRNEEKLRHDDDDYCGSTLTNNLNVFQANNAADVVVDDA